MTADEFAVIIEQALADADDGGLPVLAQIEVLERITEAMKEALT